MCFMGLGQGGFPQQCAAPHPGFMPQTAFQPNLFAALQQYHPTPTGPQQPAMPGPMYGMGGEHRFFPNVSIANPGGTTTPAPQASPVAQAAAGLPKKHNRLVYRPETQTRVPARPGRERD